MSVILRRFREWRGRREEELTVRISNPRTRIKGKLIRAKVAQSFEYVAFLGIPYALPPVGDLRFKPPEPRPQIPTALQTPVHRAYHKPKPCIQENRYGTIRGSEDCLYVNIFMLEKPENISRPLPVLVYIHGGGFSAGESGSVNPENIIKEDLIVVTINYRLGIIGFLNMRSDNCRGNAGMKDQVMALQWVKNNIAQFKGDPNNVTICGQSAGGSSVNFHMISPLSKGLFHKAIVMSGGVYTPWGYGGHGRYVKQLFKKAIGQENELRNVIVESLKNKSPKELFRFGALITDWILALEPKNMAVYYKPSIEYIREGAFLPDPVEKLMAEANPVPTIAGITKEEGYQYFRTNPRDALKTLQEPEEFKQLLLQNLHWKDLATVEEHLIIFKVAYFPDEERMDLEEKKHHLATMVTDLYFRRFYDNFKIGNLLDEEGPKFYVYEFDYFAGKPICPMMKIDGEPVVRPRAAEHTDDFFFVFAPEMLQGLLDRLPRRNCRRRAREMERVKRNMCNLWGSFCRTGIPRSRLEGDADVNWQYHTEQVPRYLHIGRQLSIQPGPLNNDRWFRFNDFCELVATMSSSTVSPQRDEGSSSSRTPAQKVEPGKRQLKSSSSW